MDYNNILKAGYVDTIDYEDIEIKYSDEISQFYFLRVGLEQNIFGLSQVYYDIMTGAVVGKSELKDNNFRHFSKKTILPEEKTYTIQELNVIYNNLLNVKEVYVANELKEDNDNKKIICIDKEYSSCEIDLAFDLANDQYKFVVTGGNDEWWTVFFKKQATKEFEYYNAITGEIISKEELENYEFHDKSEVFTSGMHYPVKVLKILLSDFNKEKVKHL